MMTTPTGPKTRKAECANCGGERNCDVHCDFAETYNDESFDASKVWYTLVCRGCDYVFIQTVSTNSEDYDDYYEPDGSPATNYNETVSYWPALSKRKKPDWMAEYGIKGESDDALSAALIELYSALDNDLHMLAAIGIRTAFDIASENFGIDPGQTFKEKLNAVVSTGKFRPEDRDRFEALVEAGNASAHRGWRPMPKHLNTMMDVLEHFIEEAFVTPDRKKRLDDEAAKVKKLVPPRLQREKQAKCAEPVE